MRLYRARTTIPISQLTYRGTAGDIIRRTGMWASEDALRAIPQTSSQQFMGDHGRCWRVEVLP